MSCKHFCHHKQNGGFSAQNYYSKLTAHRHKLVANENVADELSEPLLALLDLWTPLHVLHPHPSLHRSPHHSLLLLLLLSLLSLLLLLLLKHELL